MKNLNLKTLATAVFLVALCASLAVSSPAAVAFTTTVSTPAFTTNNNLDFANTAATLVATANNNTTPGYLNNATALRFRATTLNTVRMSTTSSRLEQTMAANATLATNVRLSNSANANTHPVSANAAAFHNNGS